MGGGGLEEGPEVTAAINGDIELEPMLCFSDELLSTGIEYGTEVQDAGNGVIEQEAELL